MELLFLVILVALAMWAWLRYAQLRQEERDIARLDELEVELPKLRQELGHRVDWSIEYNDMMVEYLQLLYKYGEYKPIP